MFESWMRQVNAELSAICGLSSDDLADQTYRDWYEDGISPEDAATMTLEDEGFPF